MTAESQTEYMLFSNQAFLRFALNSEEVELESSVDVKCDPTTGKMVNVWKPGWTVNDITVEHVGVSHRNGFSCQVPPHKVRKSAQSYLPMQFMDSAMLDHAKLLEENGTEIQLFMVAGTVTRLLWLRMLLMSAQMFVWPWLLQFMDIWNETAQGLPELKMYGWVVNVFALTLWVGVEVNVFQVVSLPLFQHCETPKYSAWIWAAQSLGQSLMSMVSLQTSTVWIAAEWKASSGMNHPTAVAKFGFFAAVCTWILRLLQYAYFSCKVWPKSTEIVHTGIVDKPTFYASWLEKDCSNEVAYNSLTQGCHMATCTALILQYVQVRMSGQIDEHGNFVTNPKASTERLFARRARLVTERARMMFLLDGVIISGFALCCKATTLVNEIVWKTPVSANLAVAVFMGLVTMSMAAAKSYKQINFAVEAVECVKAKMQNPLSKEDERQGVEEELSNLSAVKNHLFVGLVSSIMVQALVFAMLVTVGLWAAISNA